MSRPKKTLANGPFGRAICVRCADGVWQGMICPFQIGRLWGAVETILTRVFLLVMLLLLLLLLLGGFGFGSSLRGVEVLLILSNPEAEFLSCGPDADEATLAPAELGAGEHAGQLPQLLQDSSRLGRQLGVEVRGSWRLREGSSCMRSSVILRRIVALYCGPTC